MYKILPNRFGKPVFLLIEMQLRKMANANTEDDCKKAFDDAVRILRTRSSNGHVSINILKDLYKERKSFSQYSIRNIPSSRGRRGSTCSESNHSSIIIHLNGGQRSVSEYTEHPATMFRDLLIRQSHHINKWNSELFNQGNMLKVETNRLIQKSPRSACLEKAADFLCLLSYYRFKDAYSRSKDYVSHESEDAEGNVECCVQSKRYDTAPPRVFKLQSDGLFSRCTCHNRISFQEQCVHEIVAYEGFVHCLFAAWHKRRNKVNCSEAVNEPHSNTKSDSSFEDQGVNEGLRDVKVGKNPFNTFSQQTEDVRHAGIVSGIKNDYSSDSGSIPPCSDITYREWQKVQREVDGAFMNAGNRTKTKVMALQLEIRNALHLDGHIKSSHLGCDESDSFSKVDKAFQNIVVNYRKSFTPQKGNFNPVKRSLVIPNRQVRSRQPHKRLMPTCERICTGIKKGKKMKPTCGFCREENHRISTCPKKEKLKALGEEFVLFNEPNSKFQHQRLIENLETCKNVSRWDYSTNAHEDLDTSRGYKHIIIHESFSFIDCGSEHRVNIRSMFFRVGLLDGSGNECVENGPMFFTGEGLERYLYNATKRSRQGKVFVYDRCNIGYSNTNELLRLQNGNVGLHNQNLLRLENGPSQVSLRSPESNWLPLYQQVTPEDSARERISMLSGKSLDMSDY